MQEPRSQRGCVSLTEEVALPPRALAEQALFASLQTSDLVVFLKACARMNPQCLSEKRGKMHKRRKKSGLVISQALRWHRPALACALPLVPMWPC